LLGERADGFQFVRRKGGFKKSKATHWIESNHRREAGAGAVSVLGLVSLSHLGVAVGAFSLESGVGYPIHFIK